MILTEPLSIIITSSTPNGPHTATLILDTITLNGLRNPASAILPDVEALLNGYFGT